MHYRVLSSYITQEILWESRILGQSYGLLLFCCFNYLLYICKRKAAYYPHGRLAVNKIFISLVYVQQKEF